MRRPFVFIRQAYEPLGEEDRAAIATQQKTKADTIAVYIDRGIISQEEARAAMADDPDSGFVGIDPGEIPGMEEGTQAFPDMEQPDGTPHIDDQDKAGAVYDSMFRDLAGDGKEDRIWRTAKNGDKYQIDTKTEEITKGNIGQKDFSYQSRPLESTEPDVARYQELLKQKEGNHREAAHEYF